MKLVAVFLSFFVSTVWSYDKLSLKSSQNLNTKDAKIVFEGKTTDGRPMRIEAEKRGHGNNRFGGVFRVFVSNQEYLSEWGDPHIDVFLQKSRFQQLDAEVTFILPDGRTAITITTQDVFNKAERVITKMYVYDTQGDEGWIIDGLHTNGAVTMTGLFYKGQPIKGSNYYKRTLILAQGDVAYLSNKGELVTVNSYSNNLSSYQQYVKDRCLRNAFNPQMVKEIKEHPEYRTLEKYYIEIAGLETCTPEDWMPFHQKLIDLAKEGKLTIDVG